MELMDFTRTIKDYNQDAVICRRNFIAVADGATPLGGGEQEARDTSLFALSLMDYLDVADPRPGNVLEVIPLAINAARRRVKAEDITSTLTVATWDENTVRVATIGDSVAVIKTADGFHEIIDPSYAGNEDRYLSQVADGVLQGLTWEEAYEDIRGALKEARQLRNSDQGTWIASTSTPGRAVAKHMYVVDLPRDEVEGCAVVSDGLHDWVGKFGLIGPEYIFTLDREGLSRMWLEAYDLQRADASRSQYPRLSNLDDASLARVNFG